MMMDILFLLFSLAAVGCAVMVVTRQNAIYAALFLMGFFVSASALYGLLQAPFLAVLQILVYVGAILVLFLFVIMLLDLRKMEGVRLGGSMVSGFAFVPIAIFAVLLIWPLSQGARELDWASDKELARAAAGVPMTGPDVAAKAGGKAGVEGEGGTDFGSTRWMGWYVFRDYALAVEIVSILLLVAMVGAIVLARKRPVSVPGIPSEMEEQQGAVKRRAQQVLAGARTALAATAGQPDQRSEEGGSAS